MSGERRRWEVGDQLEERQLPEVSRLGLIRYAGASGDYNPIHTIDEEATRVGLQGVIQHGMLTMAQLGSTVTEWQADGFVEHFQTRFVGMVFLGEVLVIGGSVSEVDSRDGERVTFDLIARTREGRMIARGTLRFRWLPDSVPNGTMDDLLPG